MRAVKDRVGEGGLIPREGNLTEGHGIPGDNVVNLILMGGRLGVSQEMSEENSSRGHAHIKWTAPFAGERDPP